VKAADFSNFTRCTYMWTSKSTETSYSITGIKTVKFLILYIAVQIKKCWNSTSAINCSCYGQNTNSSVIIFYHQINTFCCQWSERKHKLWRVNWGMLKGTSQTKATSPCIYVALPVMEWTHQLVIKLVSHSVSLKKFLKLL